MRYVLFLVALALAAQIRPGDVWTNPADGLPYVWVPAGAFQMGCSPGDEDCAADEKPVRQVTIREGFWMGRTEVTVAAFARFAQATGRPMPPEPRVGGAGVAFNPGWADRQQPIVNVSWPTAEAYCLAAGGRLPAEAEWEWAARGGVEGARYGDLPAIAWFADNSGDRALDSGALARQSQEAYERAVIGSRTRPHPVGLKRPNAYGLYDMLGNVREFTDDHYDPYRPAAQPVSFTRPLRLDFVVRGGAYLSFPGNVRVSARLNDSSAAGSSAIGFRCIARPPESPPISLAGTRWRFEYMDTTVEFLPGGLTRFNTSPGAGHWDQQGRAVTFDNGYAQYQMTLTGEAMAGTLRAMAARNAHDVPGHAQLSRMSSVSPPRQPQASPPPGAARADIRILAEAGAIPIRPPRPGMVLLASAVFEANLLRSPVPAYPKPAFEAGVQGVVRLRVEIDKTGKVSAVEILSGDSVLAQAAADAARQWTVRPVEIGDSACEAYTDIDIAFSLR